MKYGDMQVSTDDPNTDLPIAALKEAGSWPIVTDTAYGDLFRIELYACDPGRNLRRFYRISAERDLFGDLIVTFNYGRIGTRGQTKTHMVPNAAEAVRLVRACLKRRQSAPKRIGIAYEVRAKFDPDQWTAL